jgi:hypothetical protein
LALTTGGVLYMQGYKYGDLLGVVGLALILTVMVV